MAWFEELFGKISCGKNSMLHDFPLVFGDKTNKILKVAFLEETPHIVDTTFSREAIIKVLFEGERRILKLSNTELAKKIAELELNRGTLLNLTIAIERKGIGSYDVFVLVNGDDALMPVDMRTEFESRPYR